VPDILTEVKKLQNLAYQLGQEETKEMTRSNINQYFAQMTFTSLLMTRIAYMRRTVIDHWILTS
jgi:hypothetical protein